MELRSAADLGRDRPAARGWPLPRCWPFWRPDRPRATRAAARRARTRSRHAQHPQYWRRRDARSSPGDGSRLRAAAPDAAAPIRSWPRRRLRLRRHRRDDRISRGPWWTVPFLQIGGLRNILIPDTGHDVPFTIENHPYRDPTAERRSRSSASTGSGGRSSRFDATMVLAAAGSSTTSAPTSTSPSTSNPPSRTTARCCSAPTPTLLRGPARHSHSRCCQRPRRPHESYDDDTDGPRQLEVQEPGVRLPVRLRGEFHLRIPAGGPIPRPTWCRPARAANLIGSGGYRPGLPARTQ